MSAAKTPTVSPLAPKSAPQLPPVAGARFVAFATGIRYQGRDDVMVAEFAPGTTVGGVLTQSLTASAPVERCRTHLAKGRARVLVVNAGISNVFTGRAGVEVVDKTVAAAVAAFGCAPHEVFMSSTGTIGVLPPADKITGAIAAAPGKLAADGALAAARAIMTTDTFLKAATRTAAIDGVPVTITGFCKGAGMIAPDMATMLAYVFTDAALDAAVVQNLVSGGAARSFNCVTVDGDTSTSDTLLMFATGRAGHAPVGHPHDRRLSDFRAKLNALMVDLAQQIARDGEGAEKFVEIRLTGAASEPAARRIAMSIANSPLVKTAIAGEDANWGRIVMAVGKAGEKADRDRLAIRIGGVDVARDGAAVPGYDETPVTAHMKGREIVIEVDVGVGDGACTVWTCDLTHGYIDINGAYRT
ncbi:MAG: bifunctional glutamate N-acetyltransferase/amino-acid acetyltransferase ArgJ [Rhodospirillaceae bacterium]|nr:bifunctional glutamate N-acetyltransferase/amino-acid acetyltransferase ArgJ [Rhodospirillaceae bacterium]